MTITFLTKTAVDKILLNRKINYNLVNIFEKLNIHSILLTTYKVYLSLPWTSYQSVFIRFPFRDSLYEFGFYSPNMSSLLKSLILKCGRYIVIV